MMQIEPGLPECRSGHDRFYQEIWPEAAMLMRNAKAMTPDAAEAEDLVQDTLLKAFNSLDQLKPDSNPRAWLFTLLRHTWIDRWRKRTHRPEGQSVGLDQAPEPETTEEFGRYDSEWSEPETLMHRFDDQEIIDALRLIPEGNRWALLLVDVQSLSIDEAAEVLDVAAGTVKSRLHRGRAMLRDRLHIFAQDRGWISPRVTQPVEKKT